MSALLLAILGYVLAQLLVAFLVSRRIRTEDDYLVAGRRMGPLLATGTIFATWFGAETCIGAAGTAYSDGVSLATAEPFAYGLCIVVMGLLLAAPLWRRRLVTLADLFRQRYSRGVERTAALLMIPTSLLWAAAQVRAFGQVLASSSELEVEAAIGLAAVLVIVYTAVGGLLADAVTDLIQGAALLVGLGWILASVLARVGGLAGAVEAAGPESVALLPAEGAGALALLETWSIPILGSIVAQELVVRVSAARSARVARRASLAAGGLYVLVGLVPVGLGLVGVRLLPGLEDPEQVLPLLARELLAPLPYALFAGALVSAILSTVDSTLLVCSSLLSHNLVLPLLHAPSEAAKIRLARAGVILFGVVAWGLARHASGVYALVQQASALGSAGLVVVVFFGLFTRRGKAASAYAALLAGLAVYVAGTALGLAHPYLASLAAALLGYLVAGGVRTQRGASASA
jgi:Na+/proline symporter